MGILIDGILILIMVLSIFLGYKKGLIKVAINFIAIIVSIIIAIVLYRPVANIIISNTEADENISNGIYEKIKDVDFENLTDEEKEKNTILKFADSYIKKGLEKSKENVGRYIADSLAITIIEGISFIGLLIVLRIALIALKLVSSFIENIPIIKQFNKSGGIVYGIVEGFFIISLVLAIMYVLNPIVADGKIEENIKKSKITNLVYENNIIINTIVK